MRVLAVKFRQGRFAFPDFEIRRSTSFHALLVSLVSLATSSPSFAQNTGNARAERPDHTFLRFNDAGLGPTSPRRLSNR